MATCSRCGNPITFRYIDGRCVPLHLSGGCTDGGAWPSANDYSGYSRSDESCCFLTNCPECGDEVFFIRFNGGSIWIDPPLGPPWYKHPCMDQGYSSQSRSRATLISDKKFKYKKMESCLILGVVKESDVSVSKQCTITYIETEKNDRYVLLVKYNAGFLTGRLVIFDPNGKRLSLYEDDAYTYGVVTVIEAPPNTIVQNENISCPECNAVLNPKSVKKHFRNQHWFRSLENIS